MAAGLKPCYGRLRGLHPLCYVRLRKTRRGTLTSQPGNELPLAGGRIRLAN